MENVLPGYERQAHKGPGYRLDTQVSLHVTSVSDEEDPIHAVMSEILKLHHISFKCFSLNHCTAHTNSGPQKARVL